MQVCNCSSFFAQISSGRIFGCSLQCDALACFPSYYVPIESIRGSSIHVYKCVPRSSIHVYSRMRRPYAWLVRPFCLPAGYQFCTHTPTGRSPQSCTVTDFEMETSNFVLFLLISVVLVHFQAIYDETIRCQA